jgi:hypothetical protein
MARGGGLPRAALERQPSAHDLGEDDRVVMLRISSGENEREPAVARLPPELRETRTLPAKLICVAPTELLEAIRIVSEPRPQSVLGASSGSHASNAARSRDTPRGQRRSIRIRYPSERFAGSYTRFSRTSTACHPKPQRPPSCPWH